MSYRQEQQSFSFPLLSADEILLCMRELTVPVQAKDLEKPTAATVRTVYEMLCETCIGVSREEMNLPIDEAMGGIEFPELHEDSIAQLTYFRYVKKLLAAAGVHDTNLLDVTKPDPKRFRRNLSAVINFAKFREERLISFTEMNNNTAHLIEQKQALEESCGVIEGKIAEIQAKREAEQPQVEQLKEDCKELETDLKHSNKQHATMNHEIKQLKEKNNELKDYIASLRFQKLNLTQECEKMQGNIVRSPERLKTELSHQREQLGAEKTENQRLAEQLKALRQREAALGKAEGQVDALHELMQQLEVALTGCKQASKETKTMSVSIKEHGNLVRQLETEKLETEKQVEIAQERSARLANTASVKVAAASHALSESAKERDQLAEENAKLERQTAALQTKIVEVESQLSDQKAVQQAEVAQRRQAFKKLEGVIEASCDALASEIA